VAVAEALVGAAVAGVETGILDFVFACADSPKRKVRRLGGRLPA
jgi:hypothetical protein